MRRRLQRPQQRQQRRTMHSSINNSSNSNNSSTTSRAAPRPHRLRVANDASQVAIRVVRQMAVAPPLPTTQQPVVPAVARPHALARMTRHHRPQAVLLRLAAVLEARRVDDRAVEPRAIPKEPMAPRARHPRRRVSRPRARSTSRSNVSCEPQQRLLRRRRMLVALRRHRRPNHPAPRASRYLRLVPCRCVRSSPPMPRRWPRLAKWPVTLVRRVRSCGSTVSRSCSCSCCSNSTNAARSSARRISPSFDRPTGVVSSLMSISKTRAPWRHSRVPMRNRPWYSAHPPTMTKLFRPALRQSAEATRHSARATLVRARLLPVQLRNSNNNSRTLPTDGVRRSFHGTPSLNRSRRWMPQHATRYATPPQ